MVKFYTNLRQANLARQAEWTEGKTVPLTFRMTELIGELGEMCAELLNPPSDPDQVLDEAADSAICIDLLCMDLGILTPRIAADYDVVSMTQPTDEMVNDIFMATCQLANQVKKVERQAAGWKGSPADGSVIHDSLARLGQLIGTVFERFGKSPLEAIAWKFNSTSEEHGFVTRLWVVDESSVKEDPAPEPEDDESPFGWSLIAKTGNAMDVISQLIEQADAIGYTAERDALLTCINIEDDEDEVLVDVEALLPAISDVMVRQNREARMAIRSMHQYKVKAGVLEALIGS